VTTSWNSTIANLRLSAPLQLAAGIVLKVTVYTSFTDGRRCRRFTNDFLILTVYSFVKTSVTQFSFSIYLYGFQRQHRCFGSRWTKCSPFNVAVSIKNTRRKSFLNFCILALGSGLRTASPVSVKVGVRVSVSFSFTETD